MTHLWYPGRPPFCSEDLVRCLNNTVELLFQIIVDKEPLPLEQLDRVVDKALELIDEENETCLYTDSTLNKLRPLFENSVKLIRLLYQKEAWLDLQNMATHLTTVQETLIDSIMETSGK